MKELEYLQAVKQYIEFVERYGRKVEHYRDVKDLLTDGKMPIVYHATLKRIKNLHKRNK